MGFSALPNQKKIIIALHFGPMKVTLKRAEKT